jgi:hypothetical protein
VRLCKVLAILSLIFGGCITRSAFADAISANGTCETGNCSTPDTATNTFLTNPFNFAYTFANTDSYQVQGTVYSIDVVTDSSFGIQLTPVVTVTYLGNGSGTASATDILALDFLQNYSVLPGLGTYLESAGGTFGPGLGNASSASGQFSVAGQVFPLLGPFSPPPATFSDVVSNLSASTSSDTALATYEFTLTFGSGSEVGSYVGINTPPTETPEPPALWLLAGGILVLMVVKAWRAREPRSLASA